MACLSVDGLIICQYKGARPMPSSVKSNGYTGELRVLKGRLLSQADVSDGSAFARHRSAKMLSKSVAAKADLRMQADELKRVNLARTPTLRNLKAVVKQMAKTIR